MSHQAQIAIPATYMRGGTSKGVFFRLEDLPEACRVPGRARDRLFQRVIGSPDPYGKHTDGMGGATSSTSKCVIISPSARPDHDVDYLYGQVSIDTDFVDWSGNCGNLSTAAGAFAIHAGYVPVGPDGMRTVRIWQANIGKTIIAHVPVADGAVQEAGDFELDGVTFPAAEIVLEFLDPADEGEDGGAMFPTGNLIDELDVPEALVAGGRLKATLINAGIPTIFVNAADLGYSGTELQGAINDDPAALKRLEALRATLRLEPEQYQEGVFCWKGFLYYKWALSSLMADIVNVADEVVTVQAVGPSDRAAREYIERGRGVLRGRIMKTCEEVSRTLRYYDDAYAGLTRDGKPLAFRDFLPEAPALFARLGDQLGAVQHIVSFWRFRFGPKAPPVGVDELIDIFMDFETGLMGRGPDEFDPRDIAA